MSPDFHALFGRPAEEVASAPGRVNLIGEHTDYSGGFVLPTTIPQRTTAELASRGDRHVHVWTDSVPGDATAWYELGAERRTGGWIDYVQGVTWVLADAGYELVGLDIRIGSTVPVGAGVSSSAALEMSLLKALCGLLHLPIDDVSLALLGQRAENQFVGAPCGVMDQMASLLAGDGHALFLDTRSLAFESIPIPAAIEIVVIHSAVTHRVAGGGYAERRRQCEEAARRLGVGQLRDVGIDELASLDRLPAVLRQRARHVVTENDRVLRAVAALRAGDAATLGRLFDQSHASMRDDFEVSVREVDLLAELARAESAVLGARLTGGGFGGAVVALVGAGHAAPVAARVATLYAARTGLKPTILVPPMAESPRPREAAPNPDS